MDDVLDPLALLQLIAYLQSELYVRALAVPAFIPAAASSFFRRWRSGVAAHRHAVGAHHGGLGTPALRPAFDFTVKGAFPGFAFAAASTRRFGCSPRRSRIWACAPTWGSSGAAADMPALNIALALHS